MPEVRTRIAPSPTGYLHIGTARTALFNWLYAKKHGGTFILRLEDTDKERSKTEFEKDVIEGLKWLGLDWDEEYRQSERFQIYQRYGDKLADEGKARKDGSAVILNQPAATITFTDMIRGQISFEPDAVGELVLIKSDGSPTYNFAAAVDDAEMKITHVIRGEDHIPNTPKQIALQEALGFSRPQYARIPLILAPDRTKLSKRHGATSVNEYGEQGFLPEALVNFMALLGWNPGTEQEIFSREELTGVFELDKVQKGGAIFDTEKLRWMNRQYIQKIPPAELANQLTQFTGQKVSGEFAQVVRPRLYTLADATREFKWLKEPVYDAKLLIWKETPVEAVRNNLEAALEIVGRSNEPEKELMSLANERGRGEVLWPLRVALSGKEKSPGPFELVSMLGREESIKRIQKAIEKLE